MCRSESFTCKYGLFPLQTTATVGVAKIYLRRTFINFKLNELQNRISMSPFITDQQAKFILAQHDVVQYTVAALESTEFVDPLSNATNLILFDQLFDELKTVLINNTSHVSSI
jgi:hypothetical protein